MNDCWCSALTCNSPRTHTNTPHPTPLLQLCATWVCLHPVSLGSEPSLKGRVIHSLTQTPSLTLCGFTFNISLRCLGLAFLKCQKNCPKAFQPVKLSQTCEAGPLMKYINLEHEDSIHSTVLFAYKPPWGEKVECLDGKREKIQLTSILLRKRVCNNNFVVEIHWYIVKAYIFFKDGKDELPCPTSLTKKGGEKTKLSLDHGCLADTTHVPGDHSVVNKLLCPAFWKGFQKRICPHRTVILCRWLSVELTLALKFRPTPRSVSSTGKKRPPSVLQVHQETFLPSDAQKWINISAAGCSVWWGCWSMPTTQW